MAYRLGIPQRKSRHSRNLYSHHDKEAFLGGVLIFSQSNQYLIKKIAMAHSRPDKRDSEMKGRVKTWLNKHLKMGERESCSRVFS